VVREADGSLTGHSTDGDGFVAALTADGFDIAGRRVLVLGAGAAARSVVSALGRAGAAAIVVANRTEDRTGPVVALAPVARPAGDLGEEIAGAELIVNATSVGFGTAESPLDGWPGLLEPRHAVADLVYHPLETALLRAAGAAGTRTFDGLGMLVHQAARQQELWTGRYPDVVVMRAAALAELARRQRPMA
jgi:shikimate dehydrogenase